MEFNFLLAFGLFVAATLIDAVFALYTVAVMKTQPFRAASMSFLTYIVEAVSVVSYIENKLYLIPLAFGAFAGSYLIVKWEATKKDRKEKTKKP